MGSSEPTFPRDCFLQQCSICKLSMTPRHISIRLAHAQIIMLEFTPPTKKSSFLKRNAPRLTKRLGLSGAGTATDVALAD